MGKNMPWIPESSTIAFVPAKRLGGGISKMPKGQRKIGTEDASRREERVKMDGTKVVGLDWIGFNLRGWCGRDLRGVLVGM